MHIVDVSSASREKQESAVTGVLDEMKVSDKPRLTLWNKLDVVPEEEQEQIRVDAEERGELTVAASAKTGQGLDDFVTCLEVDICTQLLLLLLFLLLLLVVVVVVVVMVVLGLVVDLRARKQAAEG